MYARKLRKAVRNRRGHTMVLGTLGVLPAFAQEVLVQA